MPTNSSLPPSRGQKANVADAPTTKTRKGRPGVARELCPNPDATRDLYAERCACGARLLAAVGERLGRALEHVGDGAFGDLQTEQAVEHLDTLSASSESGGIPSAGIAAESAHKRGDRQRRDERARE